MESPSARRQNVDYLHRQPVARMIEAGMRNRGFGDMPVGDKKVLVGRATAFAGQGMGIEETCTDIVERLVHRP